MINKRNIWLSLEFTLLFFGAPLYIYFEPNLIHPSILVLPILIGIFIYLKRLPDFKFKGLVKFSVSKKEVLFHSLTFVVVTSVMITIIYFFDRDNLFNLLRSNPFILLMLCIFYPLFSAYGQEIIYRTFLFHRYRNLFKTNSILILASGISFSFVHIVYYSHLSIILTLILGVYLARTYLDTKSVLFVAILHGAYGNMVFFIGMGNYFWLDMHKWM